MMPTKYIVKAYAYKQEQKPLERGDEVLIDLVELTDLDARVKHANRGVEEGVVLKTDKPRRLFFVELETFAKFMMWKFVLGGE